MRTQAFIIPESTPLTVGCSYTKYNWKNYRPKFYTSQQPTVTY